jgi:hypothetical protein
VRSSPAYDLVPEAAEYPPQEHGGAEYLNDNDFDGGNGVVEVGKPATHNSSFRAPAKS